MTDPVVITKEMAVTHADFFRCVGKAFDDGSYRREGAGIVAEAGERRLEIVLGPEGKRQIALLAVPATPVTLSFTGYSDAERETLLERFDRAFQRGGG